MFKLLMLSNYLQPKLVINNVEVLKHATLSDELSVSGPLYHDSLIWRIIALGVNVRSLPVILVTSDRYATFSWLHFHSPFNINDNCSMHLLFKFD